MDTHFAITRLAGIEGSWRHESPSWCLTTESLVAFVRPILIYAAPSGSPKCFQSTWTSYRWSRARVWGSRPVAIKRPRCPTPETGVLPLRAHLELCSQQFFSSALQNMHPSHLIVTDPRPLRASLQSSYCILRGLPTTYDDPNASHLWWRGLGQTPLTRPDDRRSSGLRPPTKYSWPPPLQLTRPNHCCPGHTKAPPPISDPGTDQGSSLTATL